MDLFDEHKKLFQSHIWGFKEKHYKYFPYPASNSLMKSTGMKILCSDAINAYVFGSGHPNVISILRFIYKFFKPFQLFSIFPCEAKK